MSNQVLGNKYVKLIKDFIGIMWERHELDSEFPNLIIRDDIFKILDKFCIVIFYPFERPEENNGFLKTGIPFMNRTRQSFVFINSAQATEKQIFTAAHELGHIWELDAFIESKLNEKLDSVLVERIMSRFAAEILMPETYTKGFILREIMDEHTKTVKTSFDFDGILRLIASMMNEFYVPYKAVIIRLQELGIFTDGVVSVFLHSEQIKFIEDQLHQIIKISGYHNLANPPSCQKYIRGLADLLDKAELMQSMPHEKIDFLREKFDLKKSEPKMTETFEISSESLQGG